MLKRIALRDFVIVPALELDLRGGFTALTGETGAGKSILIDALQLALGQRGDAGVVREGAPRAEIDAFVQSYGATGDKVDVVVFAAPQLSLIEMAEVADALAGRQVHPDTTVLVATSPEIKHAADRMGLTGRIEASGAIVAAGICFYQSYAGEMAEANGWKRLLTKLATPP